eukprot:gene29233-36247_t
MAKTYGSSVKWAISGRRKEALEKLRDELTLIDKTLHDLPIIIADSSDDNSLDVMTAQTKVVLTTAGPFAKYGADLVKWCAINGTHYCDVTGESDFLREMVDRYDDKARQSGARIVSHCGHDCIPWDLTVLECANKLKAKGENIKEIHFYDEINMIASGGTLDTVFHALLNRVAYKSSLGFDPLLKTTTGEKSTTKITPQNVSFLTYSTEFQSWVGPFVMAMWLLVKTVLPKPGQGPTDREMDAGFLRVNAIATGSNGGRVRAAFYFPTDPGYRDTARMLVEAGLVLALQGDQVKAGGGVWTPAACQGELLTQRLIATGSTLTVE